MRLICPHCMSGVVVPDDTAGKDATCPSCQKSFPTPARYAPQVALDPPASELTPVGPMALEMTPAPPPVQAPPVPPGYVSPPPVPPSSPSGFLPPAPAGGQIPTAAGYAKSIGFTISPKVVAVLPAVFLSLALVLTFFPWVGTYLGGYTVYSQGPWRAMVGSISRNSALELVVPQETKLESKAVSGDWPLMLPFLLLLIVATFLALLDRLAGPGGPQKVPPLMAIWPARHTIIAALSALAVALVVIQSLNGFGLERAARQVVRANPALLAEREAAQGNEWKLASVDQKEEQELAKFSLGRTTWMHLAVLFTALGALATITSITLERRGNKPPPQLLLHY